jgi:hypothetical protein
MSGMTTLTIERLIVEEARELLERALWVLF